MDPNSPSTSQMSNGSSSSVATMSPVGATPLPSPVATNGRSLFDQLIYNAATMRDSQISVHDFRDEMSAHLGPIDCVSDLELAYGALMAPMFDRLTAASQSIGLFQSAVAKTQAARAEKIVSQIKTLDEKSKKTKRKESEKDADGGPQTKVVKIASTPYHLYPNMNAPKQEMIIKCPNFRIGNIRAAIIEVLRVGGSRKCDITEAIRRTISAVLTQIIPFECKLKYTTASHCRKDCIPLPRTVLNGITVGIVRSIKLRDDAGSFGFDASRAVSSATWSILVEQLIGKVLKDSPGRRQEDAKCSFNLIEDDEHKAKLKIDIAASDAGWYENEGNEQLQTDSNE